MYVYIVWDCPKLDGIIVAGNMSSDIRIYQSVLRPCRKNIFKPNKIAKIILPILVTNSNELNMKDWTEHNNNFKKVQEIIYQMGLEDETIIQKIRVSKIEIKKCNNVKNIQNIDIIELGDYDEELTQKLRLNIIKRTTIGISYEKAKSIIYNRHIKTKYEYYELCKLDNRLTEEPDIIYRTQFVGWIDYLSIDRIYYDLETCKTKVLELLRNNNEGKE